MNFTIVKSEAKKNELHDNLVVDVLMFLKSFFYDSSCTYIVFHTYLLGKVLTSTNLVTLGISLSTLAVGLVSERIISPKLKNKCRYGANFFLIVPDLGSGQEI